MRQASRSIDSTGRIARYDRSDMLDIIERFPGQCATAKVIGLQGALPASYRRAYRHIICTGLGGSAIGADIARSYLAGVAKIPFAVNRSYTLPGFVGRDSLVIAVSYSGNTEETLAAYADARRRRARIVVITSGGRLAETARRDGCPVFSIPGGYPPRTALGFSFFPILIILARLGLVPDPARDIDDAIRTLVSLRSRKLGNAVPMRVNEAKRIAARIAGRYPVIYGAAEHTDAVATRWRGQLAENAKTLASTHLFPELDHNEIVGWEFPPAVLKRCAVIMLRDAGDHPRVALRIDITKRILERRGVPVIEVAGEGKSLLGRIFSLIYTGDFVSYYLAILNRRDPEPVEAIVFLKNELARRKTISR